MSIRTPTVMLAPVMLAAAFIACMEPASDSPTAAPGGDRTEGGGSGGADGGQPGTSPDILVPPVGAAGAASSGGDPCAVDEPPVWCFAPECGDGRISGNEVCDDGNAVSGDGCSGACDAIEADWVCPTPGESCLYAVECGDGLIAGLEQCDDGNIDGGDGCDDGCQLEAGWVCPSPGRRCIEARCGDGILVGREQCESAVTSPPAACTADCIIADGYACDSALHCHTTTCGDAVAEGNEQCDDGNFDLGDGCTPRCRIEPVCRDASGNTLACASTCGDGFKLPTDAGEECDDGNTADGDGCSSACQIEEGFECSPTQSLPPTELVLPIVLRDFIGSDVPGGHADFQYAVSGESGIVEGRLGPDGKPVYRLGDGSTSRTTNGREWFDCWYRDTGYSITELQSLTLVELGTAGSGEYRFSDTTFFPLDGRGWVAQGSESPREGAHNYLFTSEVRYWFEYEGEETFAFSGDDDVFVFVNGVLVEDIGGVHPAETRTFALIDRAAQAGLEKGNVYEIAVFQAERHTNQSNYTLTLAGFTSSSWECGPICGDGIAVGDEVCDDGPLNGTYGHCSVECDGLGPHCGDGVLQQDREECDNGVNLSGYRDAVGACAPGCVLPPYCGDASVDAAYGEECDDGVNDGGYGECHPACRRGVRCGDGLVQQPNAEECDDGNLRNGDGCSAVCTLEQVT